MSRICLALDGLPVGSAIDLAEKVGERCYAVKIHNLFDSEGGTVVRVLSGSNTRIWVDAKLHDIPKTAAKRALAIARHGARIITVHASGGVEMMRTVVEQLKTMYGPTVSVWAITVLTSLDQKETARVYGVQRTHKQVVIDLAFMAKEAGVQGLVCSPQEVRMLSMHPALKGLVLVTPGVRSLGRANDDQKRVGTPKQALDDGAHFIVVGSQVTESKNPIAAFNSIATEIGMDITTNH